MKIAILTYNIGQNYGGILQCYALMTKLKMMGHDPELLYIESKSPDNLGNFVRKKILSRFTNRYDHLINENVIYRNMFDFIEKNITPKTKPLKNREDFFSISKKDYEAYIVGSDQVWRPDLFKHIEYSFFGFVKSDEPKFLSYAPSFGVEQWKFSAKQTEEFRNQIQRFSGVSVREDSGVSLCKKYFGVEALHVLDPTALLDKETYISLIEKEDREFNSPSLLTYILDESLEKDKIVKSIADSQNLLPIKVGPEKKQSQDVNDLIYPTVTSWISGFNEASFVVTDSFHGCVFSVIFNKPFLVVGNKERGMARFKSFLEKLGLTSRLIQDSSEFNIDLIFEEINWDTVNQNLNRQKEISIDYLQSHLD